LPWRVEPNRLTRLREAARDYLDLTLSNPTQAGIEYPEDLLDALRDHRALTYEPSAMGFLEARQAVSRYYRESVPPDRILLTASTSEAYSFLFKLLCDPGDEVLVPQPSYPLFEFLAALEGVAARPYRLFYDGRWSIDRIEVTPRTRAIVAVSPNNPTGSLADVAALREYGVPVIVDEVFADYAPPQVRFEDVFYLNGISKSCGLPQMKLGWIVFPREHREALELIADTYLSPSAPVQCAVASWLDRGPAFRRPILERCAANERWLRERLRGTPLTPLAIDGGWTVPIEIPRMSGEEDFVCESLERDGVLVQPGYFYDFPREAFIVVSLLTPPAILEAGMERIIAACR
jgi:hypothetical protein